MPPFAVICLAIIPRWTDQRPVRLPDSLATVADRTAGVPKTTAHFFSRLRSE